MLLRQHGHDVVVIGRSEAKADSLRRRSEAISAPGSLRTIAADFSEMKNVVRTVDQLAEISPSIDLLVHAVGVLLPRTEHTAEGIEKDFAVSYLSRFVFLEEAHRAGLLHRGTRMVNIAASSPKIPSFARLEFADLGAVRSRTGMRSHGQAQLANDLLTAQAPGLYGITAVGYGPGSVRTSIRREIPRPVDRMMAPFFHFSTRDPLDVARQLVDILTDPTLPRGAATFHTKKGSFPAADYVTDVARQRDLLAASRTLVAEALTA